jgi:tetratricopeptide (TPR) repeat protein
MQWVNRATEREKYYINGEFYRIRDDYKNAIETYKFLSTLYPDDFTAHNNLAFIYQSTRQYEDAAQELNELERLVPKNWYFYQNRGLNSCGMGKFDEAIENFNRALDANQTQYWSNVGLGAAYLMKDMREESKAQFEKLTAQDDNWKSIGEGWLGMFNLFIGKNDQALLHFQNSIHIHQRIERKSAEAWAYLMESDILKRKGNSEAYLNSLKKSEKIWPSGRMKTELGVAYLSLNNVKAAEAILQELEKLSYEEKTQKNLAYLNWLKGEVDCFRGNYFEAIANLESARSMLDELGMRISLCKAYVQTKSFEKAIAGYQYILNHQYATLFDAYPTFWPLSHYWLAQIYEKKGDRVSAINYYQTFLQIWREADQDLPELIDARSKLVKLQIRSAK